MKARQWDEQPARSFEELMLCYLKATEAQKRSGETDRYLVLAFRRDFQGRTMEDLAPGDIRGYITARRSEGVTNSSINRDLALLSSVMGYANAEWGRDSGSAGAQHDPYDRALRSFGAR